MSNKPTTTDELAKFSRMILRLSNDIFDVSTTMDAIEWHGHGRELLTMSSLLSIYSRQIFNKDANDISCPSK